MSRLQVHWDGFPIFRHKDRLLTDRKTISKMHVESKFAGPIQYQREEIKSGETEASRQGHTRPYQDGIGFCKPPTV